MSFALDMSGVSYVTSYAEAVEMYETAKTMSRSDDGYFRIPGRRKSLITGIGMRGDVVRFRYHRTDVVSWAPDDSCTLDLGWRSRSTDNFANRFTPNGVRVDGESRFVCVDGKYYCVGSRTFTIRADGTIEGSRPFEREAVNRERAKIALKESGYTAFAAWYRPVARFWGDRSVPRSEHKDTRDVFAALRDPSCWEQVLTWRVSGYGRKSDTFLASLRADIYLEHDVFDTVEEPFAPSSRTARQWV